MSELYWITVLGNLNIVNTIIIIIGIIALILLGVAFGACIDGGDTDELREDDLFKTIVKGIKMTIFLLTICCVVKIFVPSTEKLYMIYGLGGTIDYLQKNETANKLPDKVMIALDKWIDNLNVNKDEQVIDNQTDK